jgi:hypothetical protein
MSRTNASRYVAGTHRPANVNSENASAVRVLPAPRNLPSATCRIPMSAYAIDEIRRYERAYSIVSVARSVPGGWNTVTIGSGNSATTTATPTITAATSFTTRYVPRSARSGRSAPKIWPTTVSTACPRPMAGRKASEMSRLPSP